MTTGPVSHEPGSAASDAALRWGRTQEILHDVLARAPAERAAYLEAACADLTMRRELEQLIAAHEHPGALDELSRAVIAPLQRGRATTDAGAPLELGRYTIVERLGGGGMGVVHRAHDPRLGRDVALKFLSPHLSADATAKKRFMVEARATAALEHPNICTIHEIGETADGQLYIVMAYYDGETLDRLIARGPMAVELALRIAADIARGLAKAHERGIIHRDIKPANVMITSDGLVKILDFGIAKLSDSSAIHTTGALGTTAYMSPEQASAASLDHRTDLWSLGIVLYEMLTGVRPFRGNEPAILHGLLHVDPEPVTRRRPDAPPAIESALARALAKRAADRYASAHELIADLERIAAAASSTAPQRIPAASRIAAEALDETPLTRSGERRQVTVVECITHDYAALVERLVPEELERLARALREAAVEVASRYGGIVNHVTGDRLVMLFGVPVAHEDDLLRAARATLELHARARELDERHAAPAGGTVRLRSGVHSGVAIAQRLRSGDQRFHIAGSPAELAHRLAVHAEPDAILASPECRRLVGAAVHGEPAPPLVLGDDAPPVTPYRLLREAGTDRRVEFAQRAALTPYSGRAREIALCREQLASALAGAGRMVIVIGDAGTGKSRLLFELRRYAQEAGVGVIQGRCDAFGRTTPYLPFGQALRGALDVGARDDLRDRHDDIVARIRGIGESLEDFLPLYLSLLAIPSATHPVPRHLQGEHFQAALVEALAALFTIRATRTPSLLALEDWHWADEASRELLRQLTHLVPAYPLLLVVTARADETASWGSDDHQHLVRLGPLDPGATRDIVRAVLGAQHVPEMLARQLHERTGGNPFFLEEMCRALREEEIVVVRGGEAMVRDAPRVAHLPETVQAVIRTRIDRLEPHARDVLRVASVFGRDFSRGLLERVADAPLDVARALERLKDSGLIVQTSVVPESTYRFKHVLTQEVAYDSLLEHQRKSLHGATARAIESLHADRLEQHFDSLAHHFSRGEEWLPAIRNGMAAADRATALCQFADASSTLDRVQDWLRHLPETSERRELLVDLLLRQERLCETLGQRARQLRLIDELIALLAPEGASPKLAEAYLRQGDVCTLLGRFDAADRGLGTALRISRERGDQAGERNALRSMGLLRWHQGRSAEALEMVESALAIDRARGDEHGVAGDLANLGIILRSLGRKDDAVRVLEEALTLPVMADDPIKRSYALHNLANAHRDHGELDIARRYLEDAAAQAVEFRLPIQASFHLTAIAHIALQQGRIEESLQRYRQAMEMSRRSLHAVGLAQSLRMLGEVLAGLQRHAEAIPHLREAAELFAQLEDHATEAMLWSRLGAEHERLGNAADALAAWDTARTLHQRQRDARGELDALQGGARALRNLRSPADAIPRYEEALALAARLGDHERELALRNTLGVICWERGAFDAALAQYETALHLARELEERVHEGLLLNSLGATLIRLHRPEEARTVLEDAARVNASTGQRQLAAHSHATLGDACVALGRGAEARQCFERSLELRRALGDRRGEGWMLVRLAGVAATGGSAADARALAGEAAAIARELSDATLLEAAAQYGGAAGVDHSNLR